VSIEVDLIPCSALKSLNEMMRSQFLAYMKAPAEPQQKETSAGMKRSNSAVSSGSADGGSGKKIRS
jgi:hypothetical protein